MERLLTVNSPLNTTGRWEQKKSHFLMPRQTRTCQQRTFFLFLDISGISRFWICFNKRFISQGRREDEGTYFPVAICCDSFFVNFFPSFSTFYNSVFCCLSSYCVGPIFYVYVHTRYVRICACILYGSNFSRSKIDGRQQLTQR